MLPLERLWPANVGGTIELARLAGNGRPSSLHFASTVSVTSAARNSGYARSKRGGRAVPDPCPAIRARGDDHAISRLAAIR